MELRLRQNRVRQPKVFVHPTRLLVCALFSPVGLCRWRQQFPYSKGSRINKLDKSGKFGYRRMDEQIQAPDTRRAVMPLKDVNGGVGRLNLLLAMCAGLMGGPGSKRVMSDAIPRSCRLHARPHVERDAARHKHQRVTSRHHDGQDAPWSHVRRATHFGITTLLTNTTGAVAEGSFRLGNPPICYELGTTANVLGPITVCIDHSGN